MVDPDRDRYGDKMREAERGREDDYFARRDRELIKKMQEKGSAAACPKCGGTLTEVDGRPACRQCAER